MLSDRTFAYAEEITTATLGIDAVYRRESGDEEGLVVVKMNDRYAAEPLSDYDDARRRFTELKEQAQTLLEPDRRLYYGQYCSSMLSFIAWREGQLPFDQQISGFLHVPARPASEQELDSLRQKMDGLLTQMGYSGDLAAKAAAWEARNRVEPEAVEEAFTRLMDAAWERTDACLPIPAERSDAMKVKTLRGMAFNARCDYMRRTVELNIDPVLTYPGLKHLVTHEGLPGHYLQFKLREVWHEQGLAPADGLLSVVNTASSTTFEGIADNGLRMLSWIEDDNDRVSALMGAYRSGIGTAAAWRLHAIKQPPAEVTGWLRSVTLIGGEGWVQGRMRFLTAPARSVLIWSYWCGEPSVAAPYQRVSPERRADFFRFLYGRMHSPQSVAMFS